MVTVIATARANRNGQRDNNHALPSFPPKRRLAGPVLAVPAGIWDAKKRPGLHIQRKFQAKVSATHGAALELMSLVGRSILPAAAF